MVLCGLQFIVCRDHDQKWVWLQANVGRIVATGKVLVFVNAKANCEDVAVAIRNQLQREASAQGRGMLPSATVVALHGDKSQGDRSSILASFKKGPTAVLVATDVAARGLDVKVRRLALEDRECVGGTCPLTPLHASFCLSVLMWGAERAYGGQLRRCTQCGHPRAPLRAHRSAERGWSHAGSRLHTAHSQGTHEWVLPRNA